MSESTENVQAEPAARVRRVSLGVDQVRQLAEAKADLRILKLQESPESLREAIVDIEMQNLGVSEHPVEVRLADQPGDLRGRTPVGRFYRARTDRNGEIVRDCTVRVVVQITGMYSPTWMEFLVTETADGEFRFASVPDSRARTIREVTYSLLQTLEETKALTKEGKTVKANAEEVLAGLYADQGITVTDEGQPRSFSQIGGALPGFVAGEIRKAWGEWRKLIPGFQEAPAAAAQTDII
jgi:hypothetical protein